MDDVVVVGAVQGSQIEYDATALRCHSGLRVSDLSVFGREDERDGGRVGPLTDTLDMAISGLIAHFMSEGGAAAHMDALTTVTVNMIRK